MCALWAAPILYVVDCFGNVLFVVGVWFRARTQSVHTQVLRALPQRFQVLVGRQLKRVDFPMEVEDEVREKPFMDGHISQAWVWAAGGVTCIDIYLFIRTCQRS